MTLRAALLSAGIALLAASACSPAPEDGAETTPEETPEVAPVEPASPARAAPTAPPRPDPVPADGVLAVSANPFNPRSAAAETGFTRREAWRIGVDRPLEFSMDDMWPPFWEGRSVSAGDIDGDGDNDLVFASTEAGLYRYANDGAGRFERIEEDLGRFADMPVFNAALVDLDDDGWLDLFLATYQEGNWAVRNNGGVFDFAGAQEVANREDAILSIALAFADIDGDGDLDAALGNWAAGWYREIPGEESRNRILFNDGSGLDGESFIDLPGLPGETLTILLSDLDQDGAADLIVGNDFEIPDAYYFGDGEGGFAQIMRADGLVPMSTDTTMALKSADLDNDGGFEIYAAQIAGRAQSVSERLKMQPIAQYCDVIERESDRAICDLNMEIKDWYRSGNQLDPSNSARCAELQGEYRDECRAMMMKDLAIQSDNPDLCALILTSQPRARQLCEIHFRPFQRPSRAQFEANIPFIRHRNVLLHPVEGRRYEETAEQSGLEVGGWSWDVKIADFDNDEWQDVYVVNGTWVPNEVTPSNLFFHNQGEGRFVEASEPFGLEDYLMTAAAAQLDIDHDGDLDILTVPVNGPVAAFINNSQSGAAIAFELRDELGNHFGVGARIEIVYGDEGERRQVREIQTGGGFMSFDAPVAHFGLGPHERVRETRIHWPSGGFSVIEDPLEAGALYTITRTAGTAALSGE